MQSNSNRATLKRSFMRFSRTLSVNDMRPDESTRADRAERYAKKNKTCGKRAEFRVDSSQFRADGIGHFGTQRLAFRENFRDEYQLHRERGQ